MDSSRTPLRRLKPGDRPKASEWNAIVDALSRVEVSSDRASGPPRLPFDADVVLVSNGTGGDFEQFAPFGLTVSATPTFNPTTAAAIPSYQMHRAMQMQVPSYAGFATQTHGRLGITLDPIRSGKIGRAILSGVAPCKIDIVASGHQYADLKHSDKTQLQSRSQGPCQILWRESGTGTRWAIVRIGHTMPVFFPVLVTPTVTGTYGSDSTACSKTYDVTDLDYVSLGTGMTPQKPRPQPGQIKIISDGQVGQGYYDSGGTFFLWDAGEVPNRYPAQDT